MPAGETRSSGGIRYEEKRGYLRDVGNQEKRESSKWIQFLYEIEARSDPTSCCVSFLGLNNLPNLVNFSPKTTRRIADISCKVRNPERIQYIIPLEKVKSMFGSESVIVILKLFERAVELAIQIQVNVGEG